MNYKRIYDAIIERAKSRGLNKKLLDGYFEKHHIIPKCQGGSNDKDNLVLLTGREHYLCHWLLWKIDKSNFKLLCAYKRTSFRKHLKISSRQYEIIKSSFSKFNSVKMKGRKFSEESIIKMQVSAKERVKIYPIVISDETKMKISKANTGMKRTDETKKNISEAMKGKRKTLDHIMKCTAHLQSDAVREKRSKSLKNRIPWNKGLKFVKK